MEISSRVISIINHGDLLTLNDGNKDVFCGVFIKIYETLYVINKVTNRHKFDDIIKKYKNCSFEIKRSYKDEVDISEAVKNYLLSIQSYEKNKKWWRKNMSYGFILLYEIELNLNLKFIDIC